MPKVEVTLTSPLNISFEHKKTFEWDGDEWLDLTPKEREALIAENAMQFLHDSVDWDYKVL